MPPDNSNNVSSIQPQVPGINPNRTRLNPQMQAHNGLGAGSSTNYASYPGVGHTAPQSFVKNLPVQNPVNSVATDVTTATIPSTPSPTVKVKKAPLPTGVISPKKPEGTQPKTTSQPSEPNTPKNPTIPTQQPNTSVPDSPTKIPQTSNNPQKQPTSPTQQTPNTQQQPKPAPTALPIQTANTPTTQTTPVNGSQVVHPPLMWKETQELLSKIEQKLNGKVVSYFTTYSIVRDDVKYFYAHLNDLGYQKKLYFILVSDGGDGKSAYRIASLLKSFCDELIIVIPEKAASAATMLSLAGDQIIMTPLSYLTAVDTSIVHSLNPKDRDNNPVSVEIEEVKRAVEILLQGKSEAKDAKDSMEVYKTIFNYVHPVAFGALERSSNLSEMVCRDILELRKDKLPTETANKIIEKLNRYYPAHSYPITSKKARELGLNIVDADNELNHLLWNYINVNRYITEPSRTELNDSAFHTEKVLNIIESLGRRFFIRNDYDRRLDPIIKGWTTLKEDYKWFSVSNAEENGKKIVRVSNIEF